MIAKAPEVRILTYCVHTIIADGVAQYEPTGLRSENSNGALLMWLWEVL